MKLLLTILLFITSYTLTVKILDAAETNTVSSTVVTNGTPPTANSPSVVVNNSDVCTSGYSGSVQTQVLGFSSGITIKDTNCEMIKLSRQLYGMQMKVAAVSTLCADYRIFDAMWMSSTFCPYMGAIGEDAKQGWLDNPHMVPKDSQVFASLAKEEQLKSEKLKAEKEVKEDRHNDIKKYIISGIAFLLLL